MEIPKTLANADVAVRLIHTSFDFLSPKVSLIVLKLYNNEVVSFTCTKMLDLRSKSKLQWVKQLQKDCSTFSFMHSNNQACWLLLCMNKPFEAVLLIVIKPIHIHLRDWWYKIFILILSGLTLLVLTPLLPQCRSFESKKKPQPKIPTRPPTAAGKFRTYFATNSFIFSSLVEGTNWSLFLTS